MMVNPWTSQASVSTGDPRDRVTLVEGSAFLICSPGGEVSPELAEGLFFRDTRFLSALSLRINGEYPESLARSTPDPYSATFVGRSRPRIGRADSDVMIERRRYVGRGMREDLVVRNFGEEPAYCAVEITYGADFADLFAVKEGRTSADFDGGIEHVEGSIVLTNKVRSHRRSLRVSFSEPAVLDGSVARWEVIIPSKETWSLCQQFSCVLFLNITHTAGKDYTEQVCSDFTFRFPVYIF